jgi:hypothetical protein
MLARCNGQTSGAAKAEGDGKAALAKLDKQIGGALGPRRKTGGSFLLALPMAGAHGADR